MIYVLIGIFLILTALAILIWLRKVQYDGIHRNFLSLVDRFGGKIVRFGFASRPKYTGTFHDFPITVSFSTEKKSDSHSRQFYISIFFRSPGKMNFTIMAKNWLSEAQLKAVSLRFIQWVANKEYLIEVTEKKLLNRLDLPHIEEAIKILHPFAYILVSRKGLILEKLSQNLLQDTEEKYLVPLFEGLYHLTKLSPIDPTPQ